MRKKIIAANWKMNLHVAQAGELLAQLATIPTLATTQVIVAPAYVYLAQSINQLSHSAIHVAAQDVSAHTNGAYTGEVSASMLSELGVRYSIVGHSERRQYHHEDNELLLNKINRCLEHNITILFCVGEQLVQRNSNTHFAIIKAQLTHTIFKLSEAEFANVIIAYEPVWAIGTGVTATTQQAQEMHAYIRSLIVERYNDTIAQHTHILYGGSCNATNAAELFACADIDGGLIGGASLKIEDFTTIIKSV
ncbi:MAG: triose-phosphate isomerase [Bacteroidia bacterium]